ncbi:MAG: DUF4185 domain-containing protein [Bifidobacteriaceae bacterium]|jgi:hypothetical protein|nr:DUF4185 domain-containing protein [Bifidobacteriaceae bacterium]
MVLVAGCNSSEPDGAPSPTAAGTASGTEAAQTTESATPAETTTPEPTKATSPVAATASIVAQMTGPDALVPTDTDEWGSVGGTDLGIMWDDGEGRILAAFGDTFNTPEMQGHWRSNTLFRSTDRDLTDGLTWESVVLAPSTGVYQFSKEILPSDKVTSGTGQYTVIPTAGIAVNDGNGNWRQIIAYMSVRQWGDPGIWWTQYSGLAYSDDDGENWTMDPDAIWSNGAADGPQDDPFQMMAFANSPDGQWVYMFGTPNGRFGSGHVARIAPTELYTLNMAAFEYWDGTDWVSTADNPYAESKAAIVLDGLVGELSVGYNTWAGQWLAIYIKDSYDIVLRTAPEPTGPWSDATVIAAQTDFPGLYGGFMHPWSLDGPDVYFSMSLWNDYNTFLTKITLAEGSGG